MFFNEGHRTQTMMPTPTRCVSRHYGGQIRPIRATSRNPVPRMRGDRPGSAPCNAIRAPVPGVHGRPDTPVRTRPSARIGHRSDRAQAPVRARAVGASRAPRRPSRTGAMRSPRPGRLRRPRRPGAGARRRPPRVPRGSARRTPPARPRPMPGRRSGRRLRACRSPSATVMFPCWTGRPPSRATRCDCDVPVLDGSTASVTVGCSRASWAGAKRACRGGPAAP